MSEAPTANAEHGRKDDAGKRERPGHRKLAEWVSLGVSAALIASLAAFLVYETAKGNGEYNVAQTVPQMDAVQQVGAVFILPVEVKNSGERTLRDLDVELTYTPSGEREPQSAVATIDYLGQRARQKIYFYLDHDPRQMQVQVRPLHYRLD